MVTASLPGGGNTVAGMTDGTPSTPPTPVRLRGSLDAVPAYVAGKPIRLLDSA